VPAVKVAGWVGLLHPFTLFTDIGSVILARCHVFRFAKCVLSYVVSFFHVL
jgi:hypothetical protein